MKVDNPNKEEYTMEYRFEGTDRFPDIMFTDDKIQDAKGNECYYNDIEKIQVVGRAGIERLQEMRRAEMACGVVSITTRAHKSFLFSFQGKDIDAVEKLVSDVSEMVSSRKMVETQNRVEKREQKTIELSKNLNTADGMFNYCRHIGCSYGKSPTWGHDNFGIIEASLTPNEKVVFSFVGRPELGDYFAYAITNRRLIYGIKRLIGTVVKSISLDKINDITLTATFVASSVEFDFLKEKIDVYMPKEAAKIVYENVHKALNERENDETGKNAPQIVTSVKSSAEQIREYKGLLDDGIITQTEFDAKKKELLNL